MRFSTRALRSGRTHCAPTVIFGCTSETHRRASDVLLVGHDSAASLGRFRMWPLTFVSYELDITPLMRSGTPLVTSLSESGFPEVSRPQHLPPVGFLNPSTVCSSEQRACFVSHRHHVWGSKSGNRATGDRGASWAGCFGEHHPPWSRHARTTRAACGHSVEYVASCAEAMCVSIGSGLCHPADTSLTSVPANGGRGRRAHRRTMRSSARLSDTPCAVARFAPHPVIRTGVHRSSSA